MNYLQLSVRLAQRASIPSGGLTDVTSVTGQLLDVTTWILDATKDILTSKKGFWKFLHQEYSRDTRANDTIDAGAANNIGGGLVGIPVTGHAFSTSEFVTISGTANYDGTYELDATTSANELVITATFVAETFSATDKVRVRDYEFYTADGIQKFDIDSFYYYLKTDGESRKNKLTYVEYKEFKRKYSDFTNEQAPSYITVTPDKKLRIYPMPDAVYTIMADAFIKPPVMAANADTPPMSDNFHTMIVWKALIDYAGFEEASAVYQHAALRYEELFDEMLWEELYETESKVVRPV